MRNRRWPPHESSPVGGLLHVERPILPHIARGGDSSAHAHTIPHRRQRHAGNRLKLRQYKNCATQAHVAIWAIWPALAGATPQILWTHLPDGNGRRKRGRCYTTSTIHCTLSVQISGEFGVSHDLWGDTNGDAIPALMLFSFFIRGRHRARTGGRFKPRLKGLPSGRPQNPPTRVAPDPAPPPHSSV